MPKPLSTKFAKFDASGNDFVLVDLDDEPDVDVTVPVGELARRLCQRHLGVGADGLITVRSRDHQFDIEDWSPDGSIATLCGNALRSAAFYVSLRYGLRHGVLRMSGRPHRFTVDDDHTVKVSLPAVETIDGPLEVKGVDGVSLYKVDPGTEHAIAIVDDVDTIPVAELGQRIRFADEFAPRGLNVNFVEISSTKSIRVRTYERGVEAETLSCGSGALAAALVSLSLGLVDSERVQVANRTHSPLSVYVTGRNAPFREVAISGAVELVFRGTFELREDDPLLASLNETPR